MITNKEAYLLQVDQAVEYLENRVEDNFPEIAVMMGSGLGGFADRLEQAQEIPYNDIPEFPQSTVEGHSGRMLMGYIDSEKVCVLAGRWHYYEGYSAAELTLPIRVLSTLGIKKMIFTNAAGGLNPAFENGEIVLIKDHINMIPGHPLRGVNLDRYGVRFPDMMHTYDQEMRNTFYDIGDILDIKLREGVYLALQGPSLETPAEYKMAYRLGADLVGMSTVPEVIVAKHCGMKVAGLSIVSNLCYPPDRLTETTMEEVLDITGKASAKLESLLSRTIPKLV